MFQFRWRLAYFSKKMLNCIHYSSTGVEDSLCSSGPQFPHGGILLLKADGMLRSGKQEPVTTVFETCFCHQN